ncbi:MAG: DUF3311 domain-containing protein [Proteobacteria bacterium]|nr:DUF3311 domain-containing protein [Pseudomonadota bacterium]
MSPFLRYTVGIAVPFLSVIPTVPLLEHLDTTVMGAPLALIWLFCCIPLASGCLAICWFFHDRKLPDEHINADYDHGRAP